MNTLYSPIKPPIVGSFDLQKKRLKKRKQQTPKAYQRMNELFNYLVGGHAPGWIIIKK